MTYPIRYKDFGPYTILIEWPATIDEKILLDIIYFKNAIEKKLGTLKLELISSYNSLAVINNKNIINQKQLLSELKQIYLQNDNNQLTLKRKLWKIPVCYDKDFGIDQAFICEQKQLTPSALIQLHTSAIYTVYAIGFLPGFMYLGGLPEELATARRKSPRLKITKGAVGIGGAQTGIYPQESPGGWQIIGNTPIDFFNASRDTPCFMNVGDKIKFEAVSLAKYQLLKIEITAGIYALQNEIYHD